MFFTSSRTSRRLVAASLAHTLQRVHARSTCSLRQQLNTQNPLYSVCNCRLCLTRTQDDAKVTKQLADNAVAQGLA